MVFYKQTEFNNFILENNVVGFFDKPVLLSSGRLSNWYVNWRTLVKDVFFTDQLSDYVLAFTRELGLEPKCFYGVPEGATKLGILTQYKWAKDSPNYAPHSHALAMGRGKLKEHGDPKDRYFVGEPKGETIVIEDVTTTGESLLNTIDILTKVGVPITAALSLTNRMELRDDGQSVKEAVESRGIPFYEMSNALQLLPLVYKKLDPEENIVRSIENEFKRYGVVELKLI